MEHFSNSEWLEKHKLYQDWLKESRDQLKEHSERLNPDWIGSYKPYKDWLKEHTMEHNNQTYYVEPFRSLAFEKSDDLNCYSPMQETDKEKKEKPGQYVLSLRDYDEGTLGKIFKEYDDMLKSPVIEVEITNALRKLLRRNFTVVKLNAAENKKTIDKINSRNKKLIKRGINKNKKKHDRIGYDLKRWVEGNGTDNELFPTKGSNNK
jgi:hypothetical protein